MTTDHEQDSTATPVQSTLPSSPAPDTKLGATTPPATRRPGPWQWFFYYWHSIFRSGFPLIWWVKPHWRTRDMQSQRGKVVVVTGANSGTGYETARAYYNAGATVYLACRSHVRAEAAMAAIKRGDMRDVHGTVLYDVRDPETVGELRLVQLDLSDLDSVDHCVHQLEGLERLDVLFANAGIMATEPGLYTRQGYALQFGTNTLGHQRLISPLLPLLQRTSVLTNTPSRVVIVTSNGHGFAPRGGINYASLVPSGPSLGKWEDYGQSKWGDIALSKYIHNHYGPNSPATASGSGEVFAFAVHPGTVASNLAAHLDGFQRMMSHRWLASLVAVAPPTGALNQLWCSVVGVEEARQLSGKYISPYQAAAVCRPDLEEEGVGEAVWGWCEEQGKKRQ